MSYDPFDGVLLNDARPPVPGALGRMLHLRLARRHGPRRPGGVGGDCLRLLDFKHARTFGAEELAAYRQQLSRYAEVLGAREGLPVEAWLVALRSGEWVRVFPE